MAKGSSNNVFVLYSYDLTHLNKSHKVRFVYLLKGRNKEKGIVEKLKGKFLASACFIIPLNNDHEMQQIMQEWKAKFSRQKIMLIN